MSSPRHRVQVLPTWGGGVGVGVGGVAGLGVTEEVGDIAELRLGIMNRGAYIKFKSPF